MVKTGFTVIDLLRQLRVEPTSKLTWSLGELLREDFKREYDRPPKKDLRPKTSGKGSHCFAVYPDRYYEDALKFVRKRLEHLDTEASRQMPLFGATE